ncbi:hypothetical protein [Nonomuraea sp. 10N515B]|uniref:hypothetical protein n=1 Tax=Nonomuraea sp. 10N515B TaxID=3457422 RepID=UPI003FCD7272
MILRLLAFFGLVAETPPSAAVGGAGLGWGWIVARAAVVVLVLIMGFGLVRGRRRGAEGG